jgi:excisionase family DNA binding protein
MATNDTLLTPREAARLLRVKMHTLYQWNSSGRYGLPRVKVGRALRFRRADLESWIATRSARPVELLTASK